MKKNELQVDIVVIGIATELLADLLAVGFNQ
jgi:hypothetical protein